jgi:hypothetical protein
MQAINTLHREKLLLIGACMNVDRTLGAGLLEGVYEEAWKKIMRSEKIPIKDK